jgi:alkyldihydroxyacetonephosphate synthase
MNTPSSATGLRSQATDEVVSRLTAALSAGRVFVDAGNLDAYSHDAWPVSILENQQGQHPHRPDVVVQASNQAEVVRVLAIARETDTPLVARGLGSSVTGQALPTRGGIVLDLSLLIGEPELDEIDMTVTAPGGVRGSDLESWLALRGYTMNFFPQSLTRSSIGGWIATRATGQLSSKYGGIEQAATAYTVVLSDGTIVELSQKPRAAVGPDLRQLFLGSEGMFGIVTSVTLKIYRVAAATISEAWRLPNVWSGVRAMRSIYQSGLRPSLMRFYDETETRHAIPSYDDGGCALFLSFDSIGTVAEAERTEARRMVEELGGTSLGSAPVESWYSRRFDFSTVEKLLAEDGGYAETIEVAHLWSGIEPLYDDLKAALGPLADEVLGHFSHVYPQGVSLYVILLGRARDNKEAASRLAEIWRTAMEITTRNGGELSHHHGAGLARQAFIPESLGSQHGVIRRLKEALDPAAILNPGHLGL